MTAGKISSIFKSENLDITALIKSMFDVTISIESIKPLPATVTNDYALKVMNLNVKDDKGNLVVKNLNLEVYVGEAHGIAVIPGTGEKEL
ncbi:MAG: hypothetical protein QW095_03175, partial [Nitrososphaerota archaeon]